MGRGYIVEEGVEEYLSELCSQKAGPLTGLLIGQSSIQRDFVVMAVRTPQKEDSKVVEKRWVLEHARQVSRMLPGGLMVLGVFMITDADVKDSIVTLRQLVFAVEGFISSERLWSRTDDEVTDCVTLHINPKTRKTACRTFDIKDPKSTAKPADWKYQSGVSSSWITLSCFLNINILLPLPESKTSTIDKCLKEELKLWAGQIERGVCLIDGKKFPEDSELPSGQKRNLRQTFTAQLITSVGNKSSADVVQRCGGSVSVSGAVHCRAYLHSNKPKASVAERLLKRDVISTVATRVEMLLEENHAVEEQGKGKQHKEQFCLPRRVFCPLKPPGQLCVCDYQFNDEELCDMIDRLKEMVDIDAEEQDMDTTQEIAAEIRKCDVVTEPVMEELKLRKTNYVGVVMAAAAALLASAASMMYFSDM